MKEITHMILGIVGFVMFISSSTASIFFQYTKFYVFFCISSVLVLDFVDFKLRGKSLLSNLMDRTHHLAVLFFIIVTIIFAVIVDYIYGVRIFRVWEWPTYTTLNWIVLYTIINLCFVMLVYETYKIIQHFLSTSFKEKHFQYVKIKKHSHFKILVLFVGFTFLIFPLFYFFIFGIKFGGFVMILPFIGVWLISDFIVYINGRTPVMIKIFKGDKKTIFAILITTIVLVSAHELVNRFSFEWRYVNIPFMDLQVLNVPIGVFFGWIPLVLYCISFLDLVKIMESHKPNLKKFKLKK